MGNPAPCSARLEWARNTGERPARRRNGTGTMSARWHTKNYGRDASADVYSDFSFDFR